MPTGIAVDAHQAAVRIAAFEKAVDDLVFHRAVQAPCTAQFTGVPGSRTAGSRADCAGDMRHLVCHRTDILRRVCECHRGSNAQQGVPIAVIMADILVRGIPPFSMLEPLAACVITMGYATMVTLLRGPLGFRTECNHLRDVSVLIDTDVMGDLRPQLG